MRTPETPDSPVARTNSPQSKVYNRVLAVTAAGCFAMFSSFHRPEQCDNTTIVSKELLHTEHSMLAEDEIKRVMIEELDAAASACCKDVKSCPMNMANVTNFFFWNPNPSAKKLHEFTSTMSPTMKKHIEKIAHIIALHPELASKLEVLANEESGVQFRYSLDTHDYQDLAMGYLQESQSPHFETVRTTLVERQRSVLMTQIRSATVDEITEK